MSDMPRPSPPVEKNVTTPEVAKNKSSVKGKPAKGDTKATKGKLKKTTLADLDASGIMDWQVRLLTWFTQKYTVEKIFIKIFSVGGGAAPRGVTRDAGGELRARDLERGRGARRDAQLLLRRARELRLRPVAEGHVARGIPGQGLHISIPLTN